tara:strand:+ start:721 stop:1533 length:813 start_codon:yes stop_codon:yes gene_type:complete
MLSPSYTLTVILPVFNESIDNLSSCINSLLIQKVPFECLIIDESDSQETIDFLNKYALKYSNFQHLRPTKRLGLVASLNFGLERCSTKYIARFDSDDINCADRFEKQIAFFEKHSDVAVVGTQIYLINDIGDRIANRRYPTQHENIIRNMNILCPFAHPSVMFNVEALPSKTILKYDIELKYSEDLDLWMRLSDMGVKFANLDEYLLSYRISNRERCREHWKSNLTVRVKSFIRKPKLGKLFGLFVVVVVTIFPLGAIASLRKIILHGDK